MWHWHCVQLSVAVLCIFIAVEKFTMEKTIIQRLELKFRDAFRCLGIADSFPVVLVPSSKNIFGDYQVNGAMAAAKNLGRNPREVAAEVVSFVSHDAAIAKLEIAGPGFINITLADTFISSALRLDNILRVPRERKLTVVVDYSSPNLAKEMHVGHLRSTIIGDVLVRLHEFLGNKVIRRNHVGDWGTQFGMLLAYFMELQQTGQEISWELKNLEEFYRKAKIRFDQDEAFATTARKFVTKLQAKDSTMMQLWRQFVQISLSHCQEVYERLQIKLEPNDAVGESFYNNSLPGVVMELTQRGIAVDDGGTKCIFFTPEELEAHVTTPFIIQKQDGGYLYATTDLAAVYDRIHNLNADLLLYVIDSRQSLHIRQLFATVRRAGWVKGSTAMVHVAFGTMLGNDNKPFKTRSGDTIKLTSLIDAAVAKAKKIVHQRHPDWSSERSDALAEILGIAAIKYADLSKNRIGDYVFNLDQMLAFEGNTAPYLLYAYVRIQSLFSKHGLAMQSHGTQEITLDSTVERALALHLLRFADMLLQTAKENFPHYICNYLYELAVMFMHFYETCPIMHGDAAIRDSRLGLAALVAQVLATGFSLLGIVITDSM